MAPAAPTAPGPGSLGPGLLAAATVPPALPLPPGGSFVGIQQAAGRAWSKAVNVVEYPFSYETCYSWWCPALWIHYMTFGLVLKSVCVAGNVACQISPYPIIRKFEAACDTGDHDPLPYVAIGFNGAQWVFYGLFACRMTGNRGFLILVYANIAGMVMGVYYTLAFQRHCRRHPASHRLVGYYQVALAMALLQIGALVTMTPANALMFSGMMPSVCGVVVSASQMVTMPQVFRSGSTESIDPNLAVASTASSFLWLLCGVMLMDWWLILPSVVGVGCGFFILVVLAAFGGQEPLFGFIRVAPSIKQAVVGAVGVQTDERTPLCPSGHVPALAGHNPALAPTLVADNNDGDTGGTQAPGSPTKYWV